MFLPLFEILPKEDLNSGDVEGLSTVVAEYVSRGIHARGAQIH